MRFSRGLLAGVATAAAIALAPAAAFAAGGPPPGAGGGGGGGGGGTETPNNLSVPTVFVGSVGFGLPNVDVGTTTALEEPSGDPSTGWPVNPSAYYYVQGVNFWRAQYSLVTSETASGAWGDNLSGSASLKAGHPVRVEMGLTSLDTAALQGYDVVKLEPAVADRNSSYGTLAQSSTGPATPEAMLPRVWTTGAYLTISGSTTEYPMPGEINSTGAPVFGYNWRPAAAGTYTLTFHVPSTSGVTISNSNTGDPQSISITVEVTGGGGNGGGGGHGGGSGGSGGGGGGHGNH